MILVTGATGNVGRHVLAGLAGHDARGLSRRAGPGLIVGDLPLDGVDTVFLIWPGPDATGIERAVDQITSRVRRVVYLSALAADQGFWGTVERAVESSGVEWTFLRPGGFAANTLGWAEMIRRDGEVRWPYGSAARSLIHERDIADVAVRALTSDDLLGQRPELTGPAAVTQADQARQIGAAIGREVRWVELSADLVRAQLLTEWGDESFVDGALTYWASLVEHPEPVTGTVERLTGRPARTFAAWAQDHADDFR
ncbi:SDR family oxidoreductase [Micromonosporaceae bacterium Da 78-11]